MTTTWSERWSIRKYLGFAARRSHSSLLTPSPRFECLPAAATHAAAPDSAHAPPHAAHAAGVAHAATGIPSATAGVPASATGIPTAAGIALLDLAVLLRVLNLLLRIVALVLVEIPVAGQLRLVLRRAPRPPAMPPENTPQLELLPLL